MDSTQALQFVNSLSFFGMRFGLDRTRALLDALDRPERRLRIVHVAGTNGKGSVSAFIASMLRRAGLRVGLYTSPHLVRLSERIQVDGVEIGEAAFGEGVERIQKAMPAPGTAEDPLTFFEVTTALALWHFARERVDWVVLEAGLGGRLDATNVVDPALTLVTRIDLDHTGVLGATLAEIAGEKAGIFKPGVPVVLARQQPQALEVLSARARAVGQNPRRAGLDFGLEGPSPYRFRSGPVAIDELRLGLAGPHQRENAEAAIEAVRVLLPGIGDEIVREGLLQTRWPGRFELVSQTPRTILDGAHNPNGAQALSEALRAGYRGARIHLVFGALADKDVRGIVAPLLPLAHRLYLASPDCDRALGLPELTALAASPGGNGRAFESVAAAVEAARSDALAEGGDSLVVIAGSLYVVGEARALLVR